MTVDRVMRALADQVRPVLPLRIRSVLWANENLYVGDGHGWHFNTMSSWRISHAGRIVVGCSWPDAADRVWDLCGLAIVDIELQTARLPVDPTLIFDNGWSLEVFSDQDIDPWTWQLPNAVIVGDGGDG